MVTKVSFGIRRTNRPNSRQSDIPRSPERLRCSSIQALLREVDFAQLSDGELDSIATHVEDCDACWKTYQQVNSASGRNVELEDHVGDDLGGGVTADALVVTFLADRVASALIAAVESGAPSPREDLVTSGFSDHVTPATFDREPTYCLGGRAQRRVKQLSVALEQSISDRAPNPEELALDLDLDRSNSEIRRNAERRLALSEAAFRALQVEFDTVSTLERGTLIALWSDIDQVPVKELAERFGYSEGALRQWKLRALAANPCTSHKRFGKCIADTTCAHVIGKRTFQTIAERAAVTISQEVDE